MRSFLSASERPPNIAIDQQVDHHDDRYNPAAHNSEDGRRNELWRTLRCMVDLHQLTSRFEFMLTLKACQNSTFKGCVFVDMGVYLTWRYRNFAFLANETKPDARYALKIAFNSTALFLRAFAHKHPFVFYIRLS